MYASDPLTKESFYPKRSNQKFASRKNQVKYNNLKARKKRQAKKKFDQPLDKNRSILLGILGDKKEVIKSKDWLLALGYSLNIYTHSMTFNKTTIPCIYEFAIARIDIDKYKIFRHANS
jgi:hypothetical protein